MKICRRCQKRRRNIEFHKHRGTLDGLQVYCKPCIAEYQRHRNYGISQDEFNALRQKQNDQCAICREQLITPHTDHNHDTGAVRGLLCMRCNVALGSLGDDAGTVARAITYLLGAL